MAKKVNQKRIVCMKVLPGQPTDGTGRVCIHLWVRDEQGKFTEPSVLHPGEEKGKPVSKPTKGRLACDPNRDPAPMTIKDAKLNGAKVVNVTHRTDDPRAVTCPKCIATEDYTREMQGLEG